MYEPLTTKIVANIISISQPVFGVLLAWFILNETPGIELIFATILVVSGSYISIRTKT